MIKDIAAAFVFFTRLPFWQLKVFQLPSENFARVINHWAVVGWLTGGAMALTLWLASYVFPYSIAVVLAILSRLLVTGALHEDGLADFLDGFGGGTTKERILAIMKDSHIGTYGVVGLIFYFLLFYLLLTHISLPLACTIVFVADPLCKLVGSTITRFLPYARTAETSKSKTVYSKITLASFTLSLAFGIMPLLVFLPKQLWAAVLFPVFTFVLLTVLMKKKIGGYTGDCCGAVFLLTELSFYLGVVILITNSAF